MPIRITPGTDSLTDFYRARSSWRNRGEEWSRLSRAARLAEVSKGSRVLDLGARDAGLLNFLPQFVQYQGIDIAPEFASAQVMIRDLSMGIPFPDQSFDYVFCIEVLEHLPNPFETLSEIRRVLNRNGVLTLSVPNPYHLKELIWNLLRIPDRQGHIYSWTRQAMTAIGEMNGFRLVATKGTYFHPPIPAPALLARSIIYRFVRT